MVLSGDLEDNVQSMTLAVEKAMCHNTVTCKFILHENNHRSLEKHLELRVVGEDIDYFLVL